MVIMKDVICKKHDILFIYDLKPAVSKIKRKKSLTSITHNVNFTTNLIRNKKYMFGFFINAIG